jgi:hypothetical protein
MKKCPALKAGLVLWFQRGLFIVLLILLTPTVQAAPSDSKALVVADGMDQFQTLSSKIVNKAEKKGRAAAMEAAGQTRLLLDQLRAVYAGRKTEPLRGIDQKESAVFDKTEKILKRLLKELGRKPDRAAKLTQDLSDLLEPLFFESDNPRVFSSFPGYHVVHPKKSEFDLTIKGRHLNSHDPNILLDGNPIRPSVNEVDKLIFSIPTDLFQPHPFKVTHKEFTLTVYKQIRTWYTLGFKKENTPFRYSIIVYVMPKNLARYSVKIKKVTTSVERQTGQGPPWSIRSSGRQDVRRTFSHAAENGWKFDPGSAKFVVTRPDGERKIDVNIMVSPDLITVEMLSDGKESKESSFEGHLVFTEWRNTKSEDEEEIASNKYINWKDKKVIKLPENTVSYMVSIETFNGLKRSLDGGAHKEDYVKVHYDLSLRQLSLTPKSTATILGK